MADVVVTTEGSTQTAAAARQAGVLLGMASNHNPPPGFDLDFIDWPFFADSADLNRHRLLVETHEPKYAVAPDVRGDRRLEDVVDVAQDLNEHADVVIVVPFKARAERVPDRYRVGIPFRNEFATDQGSNTFIDYSTAGDVHILGGNPTDHFTLRDRFELDVESIDSPNPLIWADSGRVWVSRRRGADEIEDLAGDLEGVGLVDEDAQPQLDALFRSRLARAAFSLRNLQQAWDEGRVTVDVPAEPGRGPPPVPPEGSGLLGPAEDFQQREEMRQRFEEATVERVLGVLDDVDPVATAQGTLKRFVDD